ncbi:MAG: hypothetical protein IPN65_09800 [Elusimicrobia bacterium]|nr:hypothetical protein [Elusimicrobiota bacterium]MBK7208005.1 hypothetical protein [Elusimicrobiota bacterium]MBK7544780.1 hypothetical protein [Elusimicrobiota bacterium]MBK7688343.1 hypothetical protein [Elusimicrobiota bacterium]MBK8126439.1 hypothetical protein [Elusimicrobiota bacterium]
MNRAKQVNPSYPRKPAWAGAILLLIFAAPPAGPRAAESGSSDPVARYLPSDKHLPRHLQGRRHWDYPWPFHLIPRGWTTFDWGKPEIILGNQRARKDGKPKPIGEYGSFQISRYPDLPLPFSWFPIYVAFTTGDGLHFRIGARWDDVDAYTQFPSVAIKRLYIRRGPRPVPPREPHEPEPALSDEEGREDEGDGGQQLDENVKTGPGGVF